MVIQNRAERLGKAVDSSGTRAKAPPRWWMSTPVPRPGIAAAMSRIVSSAPSSISVNAMLRQKPREPSG